MAFEEQNLELHETQLLSFVRVVRDLAFRRNVGLVIWPNLHEYMKQNNIYATDIKKALSNCEGVVLESIGSVNRYWVRGEDTDDRTLKMLALTDDERTVIEIADLTWERGIP